MLTKCSQKEKSRSTYYFFDEVLQFLTRRPETKSASLHHFPTIPDAESASFPLRSPSAWGNVHKWRQHKGQGRASRGEIMGGRWEKRPVSAAHTSDGGWEGGRHAWLPPAAR